MVLIPNRRRKRIAKDGRREFERYPCLALFDASFFGSQSKSILRPDTGQLTPGLWDRGPHLENFLYFSRCGITLSIPSRRFLSSS